MSGFLYIREEIMRADIQPSDKLILAVIDTMGRNNGCYATNKQIADLTGVKVRTVYNIIERLAADGYIQICENGNSRVIFYVANFAKSENTTENDVANFAKDNANFAKQNANFAKDFANFANPLYKQDNIRQDNTGNKTNAHAHENFTRDNFSTHQDNQKTEGSDANMLPEEKKDNPHKTNKQTLNTKNRSVPKTYTCDTFDSPGVNAESMFLELLAELREKTNESENNYKDDTGGCFTDIGYDGSGISVLQSQSRKSTGNGYFVDDVF